MIIFGVVLAYTVIWGRLGLSYTRSWSTLEGMRVDALRRDSKGWNPRNLNVRHMARTMENLRSAAADCPDPFINALLDDSATMRSISINAIGGAGYGENADLLIEKLRIGVREGSLTCRLASLDGLTVIRKVDAESLASFLPVIRQINGKKHTDPPSGVRTHGMRDTLNFALQNIEPSADMAPVLYCYMTETRFLGAVWGDKLAGKSFAMSDQKHTYASRLIKMLTDRDLDRQPNAMRALAAMGPEAAAAVPILLDALQNNISDLPYSKAVGTLYMIFQPKRDYVPSLIELLKHEDRHVYEWAAKSLAQYDPPERSALQPLMAAAERIQRTRIPSYIPKAIVAIGPDVKDIARVVNLLDCDHPIRIEAGLMILRAYKNRDARAAIPYLEELIKSTPKSSVRSNADMILQEITENRSGRR